MSTNPQRPSYVPQHVWDVRDTDNLDKIAKGQAVISGLLGLIALLFVVSVVLGVIGYNKITERLDNIESYTGQTSAAVQRLPAPTPDVTP